MEDLTPDAPTPKSPLPQAGDDPGDPLRPDVEEEEVNPPVGDPEQDVEATGENEIDKDDDLDDDEDDKLSELSELDEDRFADFDANDISLEDRQVVIDDENVHELGVHKRKRTEAEIEESKKRKKERKRDRPAKKKARRNREGSEPFSGGEEIDGKRRRKGKEGGERSERRRPDAVDESLLSPEERRKRALDRMMDEALKAGKSKRSKRDGIDLEQFADEEVKDLASRMTKAAEADSHLRAASKPAIHKLQLLPEVTALLNRGGPIQQSIVDPDNDLLQAIRFFLEPSPPEGSLPAYAIQKELFAVLPRLPIGREELRGGSKLGQVVLFYTKSKKPEPAIKRQAERLLSRWMGIMLGRSGDYRQRDHQAAQAELPMRTGRQTAEDIARQHMLDTPAGIMANRARVQGGVGTYTVAPKSKVYAGEGQRAPGASSDARFRKITMRAQGRGGGGAARR